MFGIDDYEGAVEELRRERENFAKAEEASHAQIERLVDVLGDIFLVVKGAAEPPDWADTQTEYYARGFEAALMRQVTERRNACARVAELVVVEFSRIGVKPEAVGIAARERRAADDRRARAAQLRAEADRLEGK